MENKKKVLIINSNYPNEGNLYGDVFVHSRVKHYLDIFDIQILGCRPELDSDQFYNHEGVNVINASSKDKFMYYFNLQQPAAICIHFVSDWMIEAFIKRTNIPILIWIHGYEALGWYRRLFNYSISSTFSFVKYMISNTRQMWYMHKLASISNKTGKIQFIFVSNWMKRIMERDTLSQIKNYKIIPNPIDSDLFRYRKKTSDFRKKILLIRSFDSTKYANDVAIEAIKILSKRKFFGELKISIYGKGKFFSVLTRDLTNYKNVEIHNKFISNVDIPQVHNLYGVFLCPTRQDAQGVSMCEAMSSGLIPISSDNTAIPEFVENDINGFLTRSAMEIADKIEYLFKNPNRFCEMSVNASNMIQTISGHNVVISKEVCLINESINR
ncbi:glycosyltransferase family 4 protein [Pararcticibacter amylolyticus]|uniref:Uncharacterized protein n=1 Tax=Pararcticibacter amylolyticus TaxID=2173175 RepID=A0A2U2PI02_9SPHI|nr:glycosyltransferase family 4 protein [Pararcticibacter amylolyticus]PWG81037.1 hypothetical protein DDR33_08905 [Pararcticibacter amylolyticus]